MNSQRPHPYSVRVAGDDDINAVNNVNNNSKSKFVNKTNCTTSKMATGSAISSTATLHTLLGKRSAQMPVRFANHETSHNLRKRKSSAKMTAFFGQFSSRLNFDQNP